MSGRRVRARSSSSPCDRSLGGRWLLLARMAQSVGGETIERATSERGSDGAATSVLMTTRTRTSRESIEIERSGQSQRQLLLNPGNSTWPATDSGNSNAASQLSARDPSPSSLTLIDANVARLSPSTAPFADKSQRKQQPQPSPTTTAAAASTTKTLNAARLAIESKALATDNLARLDEDKFLGKVLDEVNNNSIQSYYEQDTRPHQQPPAARQQLREHSPQTDQKHQGQAQPSQQQPVKSTLSQSIKHTQTQPITPLNLLTGLRMHTNNLRNQQQFNAKLSNTSSPVSFVESSLNPCDEQHEPGNKVERSRLANTRAQQHASKPLQGINIIPSYTSIFDKPRANQPAATSATSANSMPSENHNQQQPVNTYQQRSSNVTTSVVAEKNLQVASSSPIRKQTTQFDSLSSSRTLLTTISSIGNKSNQKHERGDLKKLPAAFDYSGGQLRRPIDYDNRSHSQADFDLEAASSVDRSQSDEDDHSDELEAADDEKLPFRRELNPQEQRAQTRNSFKLLNAADKRRRSTQETRHSNSKFVGTATRLDNFMKPKMSVSSKKAMDTASSKRSLVGHQHPQAQQTRISMDDMSRPPSFDTSTNALHKHEPKTTSCRKLDLLEQVAHLDCDCHTCLKNRKLASLHDHLFYQQSMNGLNTKLSKFNSSSSSRSFDKNYPKTRVCHMVLKSIILFLCTLLLIMLLLSAVLLSVHLPQSMDKVINASRSFNVTIAGRR